MDDYFGMIIFPAIDIRNGCCVRLREGDPARETIFHRDPLAQAEKFAAAGFSHLHVVDLDAAFGRPDVNEKIISRLLAARILPVQLGGGIRSCARAQHWLDQGAARIIIGTAAFAEPDWVRALAQEQRGRVILALDSRGGYVAVEGWQKTLPERALDAAGRFAGWGAAAVLHTDIGRDGLLSGLDMAALANFAAAAPLPVILSGGLAGLDDVRALAALAAREPKLEGVVSGRALYENLLPAAAALAIAAGEENGDENGDENQGRNANAENPFDSLS